VIVAGGLELRAGAELLLEAASFQVAPGDKIGLVGRNGAGKTTLARVLAGEAQPAGGTVRRTGTIGLTAHPPRVPHGKPPFRAMFPATSASSTGSAWWGWRRPTA